MIGAMGRYVEVLRLRNFRLLFLASAISSLGNAFTTVALAFGVLAATGSVTAIGIVVAARQVAQVVFLLVGGAWGDRVMRSRLIAVGYLAAGTTQGVLAVLLLTGAGRTWNLALTAGVNGAVMAFVGPAWAGAIPDVVPQQQLQQANAMFSITRNGINIGGAVIAGLLVAAVNAGWALTIDAASFGVGAVLALRVETAPVARRASSLVTDLHDGWREFISRTWVWVVVAQYSIYNMAYAAGFIVYAPVVSKRDLGGAHAYGVLVAAFGLGSVLGAFGMLRRKPRRPLVTATLVTLTSVPLMVLLAAKAPLAVIVLAAAVSGASIEIFSVLWETALQTHIPPAKLSRVSSYDSLGSFIFTPIGAALAGPLALALGGIHRGLWVVTAAMLLPTLGVLLVSDIWRVTQHGSAEPDSSPAGTALAKRDHQSVEGIRFATARHR
jgi:MFS family permease